MRTEPSTREDMIAANERAMEALWALIALHTDEALVTMHDAAGWKAADHLTHLMTWRHSVLLPSRDGITRWEAMGVTEGIFRARQDDAYFTVNESIRQRHAGLSLAEAVAGLEAAHRAAQEWLASASDEDLRRPLDPDDPGDDATFSFIDADFHNHVAAHTSYIARIVGERPMPTTRAELVEANRASLRALDALLVRHTDHELATSSDPAGWTAKDHLTHLTAWQRSVLLTVRDGHTRWDALGVQPDAFLHANDDGFLAINETIRRIHAAESVQFVVDDLHSVYDETHQWIEGNSDETLAGTIPSCWGRDEDGIFKLMNDDGWRHIDEHRGFIALILGDDQR